MRDNFAIKNSNTKLYEKGFACSDIDGKNVHMTDEMKWHLNHKPYADIKRAKDKVDKKGGRYL